MIQPYHPDLRYNGVSAHTPARGTLLFDITCTHWPKEPLAWE